MSDTTNQQNKPNFFKQASSFVSNAANKISDIPNKLTQNVGRKQFEKQREKNPYMYTYKGSYTYKPKEEQYKRVNHINQAIKTAYDKGANVDYKGRTIPIKYAGDRREYYKNNKRYGSAFGSYGSIMGEQTQHGNVPKDETQRAKYKNITGLGGEANTKVFKDQMGQMPILDQWVIGHELGHAKVANKVNDKLEKRLKGVKDEDMRKVGSIANGKIDSESIGIRDINPKLIMHNLEYRLRNTEKAADRNVPKHLKQIGMPKEERQALYYTWRNYMPNVDGRYQGKLGGIRHLYDHIFNFSKLTPKQQRLCRAANKSLIKRTIKNNFSY